MRSTPSFATLLQRFFTERLMQQRQASPHTISSRERSSNVSCGRSKAMNPFWTMVSYLQRPVHHLATNNVAGISSGHAGAGLPEPHIDRSPQAKEKFIRTYHRAIGGLLLLHESPHVHFGDPTSIDVTSIVHSDTFWRTRLGRNESHDFAVFRATDADALFEP
jgi:hypothetical protein